MNKTPYFKKILGVLAVLFPLAISAVGAITFPAGDPPQYDMINLGEVYVQDMDDAGDVLVSPDYYGDSDVQLWTASGAYDLPAEATWQMLTPAGMVQGIYEVNDLEDPDYGDSGVATWTVEDGPAYTSFHDVAATYVSGNITEVNTGDSYATREGLFIPMVVVTYTHVLYDADSNDIGYGNSYWMMIRLNPNGTYSKMGDTEFVGGEISPTGNVTISYDLATDAAGDRLTRNFVSSYTSSPDSLYYVSGYTYDEWEDPTPIISEYDFTHTQLGENYTANLTLTSGSAPTDHKVIPNPAGGDYGFVGYGLPYNIFDGSGYLRAGKTVLANFSGQPVLVNPYFNYVGPTLYTIENSTLTAANVTSGNTTIQFTSLNPQGLGLDRWGGTLWYNNATIDPANVTHISGNSLMAAARVGDDAVLLVPVPLYFGMAVDNNRDGNITFDDDDLTSEDLPYVFWLNDDVDRTNTVDVVSVPNPILYAPEGYTLDDDLDPTLGANIDITDNVTANRGKLDWQLNTIPSKRDLEDFARLWLNIGALQSDVSGGNIYIGLKWVPFSGESFNGTNAPAVKIYAAYESDGGSEYLTNSTIAGDQVSYGNALADVGNVAANATIVAPTENDYDFVFPQSVFANLTVENSTVHFLFEGCQRGEGTLSLVLLSYNGTGYTEMGSGPGVSMALKDIKEMYERWTVGQGNPDVGNETDGNMTLPAATANLSTFGLPTSSGVTDAFQYANLTEEEEGNTSYILYVHGWNMEPWERDAYAETMYKRLYWQGYQGRFGVFEWPTTFSSDTLNFVHLFDEGEFTAYYSASALEGLLENLSSEYGADNLYVYSHSHGGIVVSEALRQAAADDDGQLVETYIPSQGAVPGEAYDPSLSTNATYEMPFSGIYPWIELKTADVTGNFYAPNSASMGTLVNFENVNDFALSYWVYQFDQMLKPDRSTGVFTPFANITYSGNTSIPQIRWPYGYSGNISGPVDNSGNYFYKSDKTWSTSPHGHWGTTSNPMLATNTTDSQGEPQLYEIFSFAAQPRSLAIGDTNTSIGGFSSVDLTGLWPGDPFNTSGNASLNYNEHPWHSGEFRFDNTTQNQYWKALIGPAGFDIPSP